MFSVKLNKTNFIKKIPFKSQMGLAIISVNINGQEYNFLFDTGAVTTVSPKLKENLIPIPEKEKKTITDAAGIKGEANFFILPKMIIGGIDFSHIGVSVQDLSIFNRHCVKIDGIIGANLLRTIFWKINFETNHIYFSDNIDSINISQPNLIIPFRETFGGNPISKLKWNKNEFWAMWDTGYNSSLQISDSLFFDKKNNINLVYRSSKGIDLVSLYGNSSPDYTKQYTALLDSIYFYSGKKGLKKYQNKVLLKKNQIQIASYPAPALLGIKLMKTSKVVLFDWENQKIIFKKTPFSIKPQGTFGFTPFKVGDAIIITSIWNNSPAKEKGINVGDTISAINGVSLKKYSFNKWCAKFKSFKEKDSISISIKNEGEQKKYTLKKYPIFSR